MLSSLILVADAEAAIIGEFTKLGLAGALLLVAGYIIRSMYKNEKSREIEHNTQLNAMRDAYEKKKDELHAERLADLRAYSAKNQDLIQQVSTALSNSSSVMEAQNTAVNGLKETLDDLADEVRPRRGK